METVGRVLTGPTRWFKSPIHFLVGNNGVTDWAQVKCSTALVHTRTVKAELRNNNKLSVCVCVCVCVCVRARARVNPVTD